MFTRELLCCEVEDATPSRPQRLLDEVTWMCRRRHYSERTAEAYRYWARRFILFHGKCHPQKMGRTEIEAFLNSLADRHLSASSQSQALNGIVFLYQQVLEQPFDWLKRLDRPKRAQRLPSVLSMQQVRQILARMQGIELLTAQLIYGTGMRIGECMSLRIKDINGAEGTIPTYLRARTARSPQP